MNLEDFPLVVFQGRRLRRCPEVTDFDHERYALVGGAMSKRCTCCVAKEINDRMLCSSLRDYGAMKGVACDDRAGRAGVYVSEDKFEDYVVERVRMRISE